ncbi:MAG: tRNA threonylcarbamoyladenosine dehydratase [Treponema sp.]|nr:tRNA threonylcarbamoyladenosine dehydratase [Treponema sp.]
MPFTDRTRILLGDAAIERLARSRICVFGLGGVGSACALDLVRAGVGRLAVVDFDVLQESNLNRVALAYRENLGRPKAEAFRDAALRINPEAQIEILASLVRGAEAADRIPEGCDFYLDAIDTLNPKTNLIVALAEREAPFASCLGTAGRIAPERLRLSSIWESRGCPLGQKLRQRLRRRGVTRDFPAVWSDEPPVPPALPEDGSKPGDVSDGVRIRAVQGSGPFVPQAAGHLLASVAVRAVLGLSFGEPRA